VARLEGGSLEYSGAVSDPPLDPTTIPNETLETVAEIRSTPYAREIVTLWDQRRINEIIQIVEDIGAADWLKAHPLARLEFEREVLLDNISVNGVYSFADQVIQIATGRERHLGEFGKEFVWEQVYSVSVTGQTPAESIQRTLVHELGHHVHNMMKIANLAEYEKTYRVNRLTGGTAYAKKSPREYFAETFALYIFHNANLSSKDVQGYGMIEKALFIVGLGVKTL
jgi:hypothetical protein